MMAEGFNPQEIEAFHRDGFIILRDVFSQDEIKQLREAILAGPSSNEPGRPCRNAAFTWRVPQAFLEHDILLDEKLRPLLLKPRLVQGARQLLGTGPVHFGMSKVCIEDQRNWVALHRDNLDSLTDGAAADWRDDYALIRVGIYLQEHPRGAGHLWVTPGSHLGAGKSGAPVPIQAAPGDVAIWSLRLEHGVRLFSGATWRNKRADRLSTLLFRVARLFMPRRLRSWPEPRVFIHFIWGRPDAHLRRLIHHVPIVPLGWVKHVWNGSDRLPEEPAVSEAAEKGVTMLTRAERDAILADPGNASV